MKWIFTRKKVVLALALTLATATLAYCAILSIKPPDRSGTVIDVGTNKPVEGAYVMAVYYESGGTWFGHSGSWCVMTKGMVTGPDGTFSFTPYKSSPAHLHVIKPDFFQTRDWKYLWDLHPSDEDVEKNLYLKAQDPAKPQWNLGGIECERPRTRKDVAANIQFLELELSELIKQRDQSRAQTVRGQIHDLESTP